MNAPAWTCAVLLFFATGAGCAKKREASPRRITCFEVDARDNSPGTRAIFSARHCQGGGVTWSAILDVLLRDFGKTEPVLQPTPGWTGSVYTLDGRTRFSLDDEGDRALFCADDPRITDWMRREHQRLNGDVSALKKTMAGAAALAMECLEADGTMPKLPQGLGLAPQ